MPLSIPSPKLQIPLEPLTPASFAPYGTVIENPTRFPHHTSTVESITANQGSATKYLDVTLITNFYDSASSRKPAKSVMNMFVCAPRKLRSRPANAAKPGTSKKLFDVKILERHPFTSQTFIPLGLSPDDKHTKYLVIVAPTLPLPKGSNPRPPFPEAAPKPKRNLFGLFSRTQSSPFTNSNESAYGASADSKAKPGPTLRPKGTGLPELTGIKAFLATGNQAVTYSAGTWHAPMVVLGNEKIDFVVVQYANGVGLEDCQEVTFSEDSEGITIELDEIDGEIKESAITAKAKL